MIGMKTVCRISFVVPGMVMCITLGIRTPRRRPGSPFRLRSKPAGRICCLTKSRAAGRIQPRARCAQVLDWNGDGLKDLVCSSDNGVYWCQNTNHNSIPVLQAPVPIRAPVFNDGLMSIITAPVPGARMRVYAVDWNNDGIMDLLLGNANGTLHYYEGYQFAFTRVAPQPGGRLLLEWSSAPYLRYHLLADDHSSDLQHQIATNLPSGGMTTTWTNLVQESQQYYHVRIAD